MDPMLPEMTKNGHQPLRNVGQTTLLSMKVSRSEAPACLFPMTMCASRSRWMNDDDGGPMRATRHVSQCCDIPRRNALTESMSREDRSDRFGDGVNFWVACAGLRSPSSPRRSIARLTSGTLAVSSTSLRVAMRSSPTQSLEAHAVTSPLLVRHRNHPLRRQAAICVE